MLKLAGVIDLPEATCYPDDLIETQWYVLPVKPVMRRETNGKAAFKFVKYRTPRPMANGEIGAALVFMDVQLALTAAEEQSVRARIAEAITARRGPGGQPVEPAQLTLTRPQWTKAEVLVEVLGGTGNLVQKVNHAGVPSMYGSNVVAMSAELNQFGAPIFEGVMKSDGLGGVRVVYKMEFNARMPPVQAFGTWSASKFYSFTQEVDFEENFWSEDDFSEKVSEIFTNSESRNVVVDPGGQANEAVQQVLDRVEAAVTAQLDEAVKRNLLESIPPESRDFSKIRDEDFENIRREVTVNKRSDVSVSMTVNQVIPVPVAPQANMPSVVSQGDRWEDYAIEVEADDPFFKQLNVAIAVNADFENLPIFSVDVSIDYPPERNRGGIQTFTFKKADDVARFIAFTDGGPTAYKYRYVVNYVGEARTFQSPWTDHDGNDLKINVDELGLWLVDVRRGDIDFNQVTRAVLTLEHPEVAPGVPPAVRFEIKDDTEFEVREVLLAPVQPYDGSITYFMKDGREFVRRFTNERTQRFFVDDPFTATRTLVMRARGDLESQIRDIAVDATYRDPDNDYTQTTQVTLSKEKTFAEWKFPVIDEQAGTLTCRAITSLLDGSQVDTGDVVVTGVTEFFGIDSAKLTVTINPDLIPFDIVKLVSVTLHYVDADNGIDESESFTLRVNGAPQKWELPIRDRTKKSYEWKATFFLVDGSRRESSSGGQVSDESLFVELPA